MHVLYIYITNVENSALHEDSKWKIVVILEGKEI